MLLFQPPPPTADTTFKKNTHTLPRMRNLPAGLTPARKIIYKQLLLNRGSYLVQHKTKANKICFRLIDAVGNPVQNIKAVIINRMLQQYLLKKCGMKYVPVDKEEQVKLLNQ